MGKYEPQPDCHRCNGTGRYPEGHKLAGESCVCTFFGEHTSWLAPAVAEAAQQLLKEHNQSVKEREINREGNKL